MKILFVDHAPFSFYTFAKKVYAVHVAITRKVLPGEEEEFKAALRKFLGESFAHGGFTIGNTQQNDRPAISPIASTRYDLKI